MLGSEHQFLWNDRTIYRQDDPTKRNSATVGVPLQDITKNTGCEMIYRGDEMMILTAGGPLSTLVILDLNQLANWKITISNIGIYKEAVLIAIFAYQRVPTVIPSLA